MLTCKEIGCCHQITVFLASLKAGGLGLNLTNARTVYLIDPWWNPAVEDQAINRVHRLGQRFPVHVRRLIAQDTVEETMLLLQEKKRRMSEAALASGRGMGEANKLTLDDLKMFFKPRT